MSLDPVLEGLGGVLELVLEVQHVEGVADRRVEAAVAAVDQLECGEEEIETEAREEEAVIAVEQTCFDYTNAQRRADEAMGRCWHTTVLVGSQLIVEAEAED